MAINSNVCSHFFHFRPDDNSTGAFSQKVGKLFSELKLVTDNFLFIGQFNSLQHSRFILGTFPNTKFVFFDVTEHGALRLGSYTTRSSFAAVFASQATKLVPALN